MNRTKLAWITAIIGVAGCGGGGGNGDAGRGDGGLGDAGPPMPPIYYVVSDINIPPPSMANEASGYNLDGMETVADPAATNCVDFAQDFTSLETMEPGVDNAMAGLMTTLASFLMCPAGTTPEQCVHDLLLQQIAEGKVLLVAQVTDVNSFNNDPSVTVQLYRAQVPGCDPAMPATCAPMLTAGGTLAPGQALVPVPMGAALGAPVTGSIVNGRLTVQADVIPLSVGSGGTNITLMVRNARFGAQITATGLSAGAIGGSISVDEVVAIAVAMMLPEATARMLLGSYADLVPSAADPLVCEALSAGIHFEAVTANFTP